MRKTLSKNELHAIQGGISSADCAWLWSMCIAYPHGCTNPCQLWNDLCTG